MPAPRAAAHSRCRPSGSRSRRTKPVLRAGRCRAPATGCGGYSGRPRALPTPIGDARIEPGIDHIEHKGGEAEGDDDGEDDALDHTVVVLADRLVEKRADAGI